MPTFDHEQRAFGAFGRSHRHRQPKVVIKKQPHGAVVNECVRWLFAHGVYCWVNRTGGYEKSWTRADGTTATTWIDYGKKGSGDIVGITRNGVHIEVEAKTPDDRQREDQSNHEREIKDKGGIYIVAYGIAELEARKDEITGFPKSLLDRCERTAP